MDDHGVPDIQHERRRRNRAVDRLGMRHHAVSDVNGCRLRRKRRLDDLRVRIGVDDERDAVRISARGRTTDRREPINNAALATSNAIASSVSGRSRPLQTLNRIKSLPIPRPMPDPCPRGPHPAIAASVHITNRRACEKTCPSQHAELARGCRQAAAHDRKGGASPRYTRVVRPRVRTASGGGEVSGLRLRSGPSAS